MDVILLAIKDVKGNCTIDGHADEIILNSYGHSVALPMSMDVANTERTAGKPMFSEGSVSVSPLWRFTVPADAGKVRVEVK